MKPKFDYISLQLKKIKSDNLYRKLHFEKVDGEYIAINKKKLLNLCSNDYLGIPPTKLPIKQMQSSSRLVSGNDVSFEILEKKTCKTQVPTKNTNLSYRVYGKLGLNNCINSKRRFNFK